MEKKRNTEARLRERNALQPANLGEGEGRELIQRREACVKHFDLGKGRFQAVIFPDPVHYMENGAWREIDNNLEEVVENGRTALRTRANPLGMELAANAGAEELVRLTSKGKTLSWRFERASNAAARIKSGAQLRRERLYAKAQKLSKFSARTMSSLSEAELASAQSAGEQRADLSGNTAQVRYEQIAPGVTARYSLMGLKLKEDLILESKEALANAALILDGGMDYALNPDGSIAVRDKDTQEELFIFDPPVTYDVSGKTIEAAPVLTTLPEGVRLSYAISEAALDAAAYPITIDPVVHSTNPVSNVEDLTLVEGQTTAPNHTDPYMRVGAYSGKEYMGLVRFKKLAKLQSSETIVSALMRMTIRNGGSDQFVAVREVTGAWNASDVRYSNIQMSEDELDYANTPGQTQVLFNVTGIYRKWYQSDGAGGDKNYGVVLRKPARVGNAQQVEVYTSEVDGNAAYKPVMYVNYLSHAGLEGWWTYESQSAGRAGMAHVDLFNGNLVVEHGDTAMNGSRMPVCVSHYYNSCQSKAPEAGAGDIYRCGYGWKHSGLQRVYAKTLNATDYLVWVDGDGTEHWFKNKGTGSANSTKDEEGQQLELTRYAADGATPPRIAIVDKQHTKLVFRKRLSTANTGTWNDYWLTKAEDAHGNAAQYTYEMPANLNSSDAMRALEGKLLKITDGAGRETTFAYNADGLLQSIQIPAAGNTTWTVSYSYASGQLTGVHYSDLAGAASHTTYSYLAGTNLLSGMSNHDGLSVKIGYEDMSLYASANIENGADDQMRRVVSLETVNGAVAGARQLFQYQDTQTVVTAVADTASDAGKRIYYQFNDTGNLVAVRDELGYARFAMFDTSINAATEVSKLQRVVVNHLLRPDFGGTTGAWSSANTDSANTAQIDAATRCLGLRTVRIEKASAAMQTLYRQTVRLEAAGAQGKKWSLSAYAKTSAAPADGYNAYLRVCSASGVEIARGEALTTATPAIAEADKVLPADGWERLHLVFEMSNATPQDVRVELVNASPAGTVWFGCPQLEEGAAANSANLVSNGDFRVTGGSGVAQPVDWVAGDDIALDAEAGVYASDEAGWEPLPEALKAGGSKMLRFASSPRRGSANYSQEIEIKGSAGDVFTLGGWANARSAPGASTTERGFRVTVQFYDGSAFQDASKMRNRVPFNFAWVGWQYMMGACIAPCNYTKARISVVYMKNINKANFTGIFLHREQYGKTFTYDGKKNVLSVTTRSGQQAAKEYDDYDNLISYRQPGRAAGVKHVMSYGGVAQQKRHLLQSATSPMGVKTEYTYDAYGNMLTSKLTKKSATSATPAVSSSTAYSGDGNYAASTTDARGNISFQDVEPNAGTLISATDPNGARVAYAYDDSKRVTSVTCAAGEMEGDRDYRRLYHNAYTYQDDRLKTVSHNTGFVDDADGLQPSGMVTYTFDYDSLGSQTRVRVGSQTLSTNTYSNDRAHLLKEVAYGNGGKVRYEHDGFDRLTGVRYDNEAAPRYAYEYGANGQVARVSDSHLNRVQWTEYDQAQRPAQTHTYEGNTPVYRAALTYDKYNNLSKLSERVGSGQRYETTYEYDDGNRATQIRYGADNRKVLYGYDEIGRLKTRAVTNGSAYTATYGYLPGDTGTYGVSASTNLVGSITQGSGENAMNFSYTYDSRGNILSESRNGQVTEYSYDALGQLTSVSDPHEGAVWEYEYDCGGNILRKRRYAWQSDGSKGALAGTVSYGYDGTWKDKLSSYDGNAIAYDAIGNPLSYGGRTYEWEAGRQLKKLTMPAGSGGGGTGSGGTYGTTSVNGGTMAVSHTPGTEDSGHTFTVADGNLTVTTPDGNPYTLANGVLTATGEGSASGGAQAVEFKYDANGLRVQKTVTENGAALTTDYILHGKLVMGLKRGSDQLHFFYDKDSRPALVELNGTCYTYVHNLQGDVVALLDGGGNKVVEYQYDAWGRPTGTWSLTHPTDSTLTSEYEKLARLNPFRYRGYVWDEETGLYYLRSRYYDPAWGRFINADNQLGKTGRMIEHNVFSYCKNNSINYTDPNGMSIADYLGIKKQSLVYIFSQIEDDFGKLIVWRWIMGQGNDYVIRNNNRWDEYITTNQNFKTKLEEQARLAIDSGKTTFEAKGNVCLSDTGYGGYYTGYELINSCEISGTFLISEVEGRYVVSGTYELTDRIDANKNYIPDMLLWTATKFYFGYDKGNDYDLKITGNVIYILPGSVY